MADLDPQSTPEVTPAPDPTPAPDTDPTPSPDFSEPSPEPGSTRAVAAAAAREARKALAQEKNPAPQPGEETNIPLHTKPRDPEQNLHLESDPSQLGNPLDPGGPAVPSAPDVSATVPGTPKAPDAPTSEPNDLDEIPAEVEVKGKKYENRIPFTRVKEIVENHVKKATEALEAKILTATQQYEAAQGQLNQYGSVEEVMRNDPDRFVQMMSQVHPGYAKFLSADPNASMPRPDKRDKQGNLYYSAKQAQALAEWRATQVQQQYTPLETYYNQSQQEQERLTRLQEAQTRVDAQLEAAKKWPRFEENRDAIAAVIEADPTTPLEVAYHKVVTEKLVTDRDKIRQEVLAEVNSKPSTTAAPAAPVKPAAATSTKPRSTSDIVRQIMRTGHA